MRNEAIHIPFRHPNPTLLASRLSSSNVDLRSTPTAVNNLPSSSSNGSNDVTDAALVIIPKRAGASEGPRPKGPDDGIGP